MCGRASTSTDHAVGELNSGQGSGVGRLLSLPSVRDYYEEPEEGSRAEGSASYRKVRRNLNWIWFVGAAVWFFDAMLEMRHGLPGRGLVDAGIAALFLILGLVFRRFSRREEDRRKQR